MYNITPEVKIMTFEELTQLAKSKLNPQVISKNTEVGKVSCALETIDGNVYTGINIDTACSMGYCAEANAIGTMVTNSESIIKRIVAVSANHGIVPPCGRCREFMVQINEKNLEAEVLLDDGVYKLKDLLPKRWEH